MPSNPETQGAQACRATSERSTLSPLAPLRIAWRERDIRRLLAGLAASETGDWLYNLALLALVYERTGSSTWLGITTAARILPVVVFGPFGGVLADRVNRRFLMVASDLVRAGCMAALTAVALVGGPVVLVPLLAALCTAAGAAYAPCVLAVLPRLVDDTKLPAVNAARAGLTQVAIVGGPVVGAALLLAASPAVALAVNGATFLVGAAIVAGLPRAALRLPADPATATLRSDLLEGWRALRGHPAALRLVGTDVVGSAVYGAVTVLFVLLGRRLGLGDSGYGVLLAAVGVGGVLSAGLANRAAAAADPRRVLAIAMVAVGAPIPLLALVGAAGPAIVLAATLGAGSLVFNVVFDTHLQRTLDPAVFARAYGLAFPAAVAGIVAGALLAPPCLTLLGLDGTLALFGALALGCVPLVSTKEASPCVR